MDCELRRVKIKSLLKMLVIISAVESLNSTCFSILFKNVSSLNASLI